MVAFTQACEPVFAGAFSGEYDGLNTAVPPRIRAKPRWNSAVSRRNGSARSRRKARSPV
jgi:hypothetical protein